MTADMYNPDSIRTKDGRLPSMKDGKIIAYVMHDGYFMCPACANGRNDSDAWTNAMRKDQYDDCQEDLQWKIVGWQKMDEDRDDSECCHCGKKIPNLWNVITPAELMSAVMVMDIDYDNLQSDLYVKSSVETTDLLQRYVFECNVTMFIHETRGEIWYDVPFIFKES